MEYVERKRTWPEPIKIINILTGYFDVHSPHTTNDIHGEYNGTKDSQFAQDIRSFFLALIHPNVNLGQVVAVSAR